MAIYTITLKDGEKVILPANTKITAIIEDGATLTSSCENLPLESVPYKCYHMDWGISTTSGDDAVLEDDETVTIESIVIGGTTYTLGINSDNNISTIKSQLEVLIPQSIFKIYSGYKDQFNRFASFGIKFKTTASLAPTIQMKIVGLGFPNGLFLMPQQDSNCNCDQGHDENVCDADEDGGTP